MALAVAPVVHSQTLTMILDFETPYSRPAIAGMKHELERVMRDSGYTFDWRVRGEVAGDSFSNLIALRFKGKCVMGPPGYLYDERGPLAFTYTTDGVIQPFADVDCDKVASTIRSALWGGDYQHADELLGRALGRVVAHELVHMLARSDKHGRDGIARESLSARRLIAPELKLSAADLKRILRAN